MRDEAEVSLTYGVVRDRCRVALDLLSPKSRIRLLRELSREARAAVEGPPPPDPRQMDWTKED